MNRLLLSLLLAAFVPLTLAQAQAQDNLIPNGNFTAADPLEGWRIDFPYEGWYVDNHKYISATGEHAKAGGKCVKVELPPGIAGNQGGKIESAFVKAEPGATYRVEIDCLTHDFGAKLHAEAWVTDPKPVSKPDKMRVPAMNGHPGLAMVYRAQMPDPHGKSQAWETVSREFTLPKTVRVAGKEMPPEFLSLKAVVYAGTQKGGTSYFANFRLTKVKSAQ